MKRSFVVPWNEGLHLKPAASLAKSLRDFRSTVWLTLGKNRADAHCVLSILMLAASMGAMVEVEAMGDDEVRALECVEQIFQPENRASTWESKSPSTIN